MCAAENTEGAHPAQLSAVVNMIPPTHTRNARLAKIKYPVSFKKRRIDPLRLPVSKVMGYACAAIMPQSTRNCCRPSKIICTLIAARSTPAILVTSITPPSPMSFAKIELNLMDA